MVSPPSCIPGVQSTMLTVCACVVCVVCSGTVELMSKIALASENAHLRSEVAALQRKLGHGGGMKRAKAVESLSDRMQWAKAELRHIKGSHVQQLRIKEAGIETVPQKMPGEFSPECALSLTPNPPPPPPSTCGNENGCRAHSFATTP